jgi:Domain of unknown function (DUF4124)
MKRICLLLAVIFAPAAGASYRCVDEKGVTHVGDMPPEACANVVIYELHANGMVLRKIDPTPTAEQAKVLKEKQEKSKEAERVAADQKRKDEALLASFSGEREFDVTRDRNIEPLNGRITNARDRIAAINKRMKEIEDEMEFYKSGKAKADKPREAPFTLTNGLQVARTEKESLEKSIVSSQREIEILKVKFDTDKKRWVALKMGGGVAPPPPTSAASAAVKTEAPKPDAPKPDAPKPR